MPTTTPVRCTIRRPLETTTRGFWREPCRCTPARTTYPCPCPPRISPTTGGLRSASTGAHLRDCRGADLSGKYLSFSSQVIDIPAFILRRNPRALLNVRQPLSRRRRPSRRTRRNLRRLLTVPGEVGVCTAPTPP